MTGMTRFASLWVENGKVQAPLSVMRFDESMYRALGENLVDLTNEQEIMLDPGTYFERSSSSSKVPGALTGCEFCILIDILRSETTNRKIRRKYEYSRNYRRQSWHWT